MLIEPRKRQAANVAGFVNFLRMAAGNKRVAKPTKKPPSGKLKAKKPINPKTDRPRRPKR